MRLTKGVTTSDDLICNGKMQGELLDQVAIRMTPQATVRSDDLDAIRRAVGDNEYAQQSLGKLFRYVNENLDRMYREREDRWVVPVFEVQYAGATFIFMRS